MNADRVIQLLRSVGEIAVTVYDHVRELIEDDDPNHAIVVAELILVEKRWLEASGALGATLSLLGKTAAAAAKEGADYSGIATPQPNDTCATCGHHRENHTPFLVAQPGNEPSVSECTIADCECAGWSLGELGDSDAVRNECGDDESTTGGGT